MAWLIPLVALATTGCFATTNDVRLLQAHIEQLQRTVETAHSDADKARLAELQRDSSMAMAIRSLATLSGTTRDSVRTLADSIRVMMDAFSRFKADVALTDSQIVQMLYTSFEMAGASQKRIADLQAGFDAAREQRALAASPGDTAGRGGMPGPTQLYQLGFGQLQNSRAEAARDAFLDFLRLYPKDKLLPNATFNLAESYAKLGDENAADSVYNSVVVQFPKSAVAPTALFKRAGALEKAGQPKAARALYQQIVHDYAKSDEFRKANDRLKALPPL